MTREEHFEKIKALFDCGGKIILRLPTSFGKSKCAIDLAKSVLNTGESLFKQYTMLIVVPKLVLIDNWKEELKQWGLPENIEVTFSTYVSYPKHVGTPWDIVVFDETHHFTENCFECTFNTLKAKYVIAMSATIPKEPRWRLKDAFPGIKEYAVTARTAIEENILPDPKILFIPCMLDNTNINETIIKQGSKPGTPIVLFYSQRRKAWDVKNRPIHIRCTQQEWYTYTSEIIDWWKQQYIASRQPYQKNQWLRTAKVRLDWLAEKKSNFVKDLLEMVEPYRVLTFCTSIEQTENLGKYCINSKNKASIEYLENFNEGKINHITACGMLNEGMNLKNCQIGIYANIGSSEIVEIQRLGRLLRHKNPLIIIPYYVGTREEEIVNKMKRNYNPKLMVQKFRSEITPEAIKNIIEWNPNLNQED